MFFKFITDLRNFSGKLDMTEKRYHFLKSALMVTVPIMVG